MSESRGFKPSLVSAASSWEAADEVEGGSVEMKRAVRLDPEEDGVKEAHLVA